MATDSFSDKGGGGMDEMVNIVLSFILGFFSAVFAEPLRRRLFRSRLEVNFKADFSPSSKYIFVTPSYHGSERRTAKHIRVSVRNPSRITAKSCKAFLTKIEREGASEPVVIHQDPLPLSWGFIGAAPIDIPPGPIFFFDVFAVDNRENKLQPQTNVRPNIWDELLQEPGKYFFSVLVAGDNLTAVPRTIPFQWNGSFDAVTEGCL
jgi:hypothetical protein